MRVLGISAFYHDSAAALVEDGRVLAAAQEERFTRKKHDPSFPARAIEYCLAEARCGMNDIDHVVFYDKPFLKFERLLETYLATSPRGFRSFKIAMPVWIKEKLFQKKLLRKDLGRLAGVKEWAGSLLFTEHHLAHAASAYFPSPFPRAAVLTMDGVGEWCTTSLGHGRDNHLEILKEIHFPHSLGLLYSAFTYYTGFKVNSGEYKLMGLAPYGRPRFAQTILDHLIDLKEDGSFRLDQRYFDYCTGLTMTSPAFHRLFGGDPRKPESPLTQREMDLAASIQSVTEEVVLRLARFAKQETNERSLCLAGGVALNCVANGKLLKEGLFEDIWVQPAAGDAGGALGAALAVWHGYLSQPRATNGGDSMAGAYLGPSYEQGEIEQRLTAAGATYRVLSDAEITADTVEALVGEKAVGWMQGRMEFGPRALGARSILGDPRSPTMQKTLNLKVKYRESFRPFAPSVRREDLADWFDLDADSPYMLLVADVLENRRLHANHPQEQLFGIDLLNVPRSEIPAVTHVDYSARIQTVHRETNPRYWDLLTAFKARTGCPVLVNTSFNVRGEPIVCTPEDAFRCFMGTEIERLVVGNCMLKKEDQPERLRKDYKEQFELD
ncbi:MULTISPECIES: carbamoyltransferase [unclassified Sinorhizobium]|uniref:carbamoyltransferase family protein n=1 Tax=unclassified Sinorhizobium TaxID=2613772 RepID=UPI0024C3B68A|nr:MULTISPECIES: carbamoyltransferase [unclassified Sinorhizobium]MDK1378437.1 carbamoyltransferase [Sinorhizobium sp. 6-70]MDK1482126.1 carbamoyltransferase [Sinorhizobium sp. 6-117]